MFNGDEGLLGSPFSQLPSSWHGADHHPGQHPSSTRFKPWSWLVSTWVLTITRVNTRQALGSSPGAGWSVLGYLLWPLCQNSGSFNHFTLPVSFERVRNGGRVVERRTVNRGDGGSIPPAAISKLRQFHSPHICLCLSEEPLKAGGPFYLVSMPGEVKDPTQGVNV